MKYIGIISIINIFGGICFYLCFYLIKDDIRINLVCFVMKDAFSDENMFSEIYREYKARFIYFAWTYVRDEFIAEDLVVESFMYYWENRRTLVNQLNIPAYILTVIKNKCLNYLQREKIRENVERNLQNRDMWELQLRIATLEACNPEMLFSKELHKLIDKTLESLPSQSREIFIRSRYENQTNKEIAMTMGLSVKSVEYHITKTLKIFRKALADYFPLFLF